jgi:glycosyltransferase involved in cell wall biosynthesis
LSGSLPLLRERLDLAIITYNRSAALERTLEQLFDSPFAECPITVLDNCSTDDTPTVCRRWAERFADLRIVRHRHNIGLSGNYLRAVELSNSTYTWVLSDDESYDFSGCDDVVATLREGEIDLLMIGSPHQQAWEHGLRTTVPDLIARGGQYHAAFTFIAGSLFRTSLFDSRAFVRGYRYGDTIYPHFPFVHDQVGRGSSIYVARRPIVVRTRLEVEESVGDLLGWMSKWARACELIAEHDLRRAAIYESAGDRRGWVRQLVVHTMLTRLDDPRRLPRYLADLLVACRGEQRLIVIACLPLAVVPRSILKVVRRVVRRRRGIPMTIPEFDEFRV